MDEIREAVRFGDIRNVHSLLEKFEYLLVDVRDLLHTCISVQPSILTLVLMYNPNVNFRDKNGEVAIHLSVRFEKYLHCRTLLQAGACINVPSPLDKCSALDLAYRNQSLEISSLLENYVVDHVLVSNESCSCGACIVSPHVQMYEGQTNRLDLEYAKMKKSSRIFQDIPISRCCDLIDYHVAKENSSHLYFDPPQLNGDNSFHGNLVSTNIKVEDLDESKLSDLCQAMDEILINSPESALDNRVVNVNTSENVSQNLPRCLDNNTYVVDSDVYSVAPRVVRLNVSLESSCSSDLSAISLDSLKMWKDYTFTTSEEKESRSVGVSCNLSVGEKSELAVNVVSDSEELSKVGSKNIAQDKHIITAGTWMNFLDSSTSVHPRYSGELFNFVKRMAEFPNGNADSWLDNSAMDLLRNLDNYFQIRHPGQTYREGFRKSCFCYLLLDPRVVGDTHLAGGVQSRAKLFLNFLGSIFYIGKGSKNRPYQHFVEAYQLSKRMQTTMKIPSPNIFSKNRLSHICSLWEAGYGVLTVHCFHDVIAEEAYTRESAMISALGIHHLCNKVVGCNYGPCSSASPNIVRQIGAWMLYQAHQIFLIQGARQIYSVDIASC